MSKLTFLGGAGTVTGSKYLLEHGSNRILVDCGLYQGFKRLRELNWSQFPCDPASIDTVVITHAHIDHSGYLPVLVKNGFKGRVICTEATRDLCAVLLPDSGHLQEREAEFANRHHYSKHKPALPLYTQKEAEAALSVFHPTGFHMPTGLGDGSSVRFHRAGHILGAAIAEIDLGGRTIVFSGDLGRPGSATMVDPEPVEHADYLLVESTYGNRIHDVVDPEEVLANMITRTAERGGTVVVPSFAVGRAQSLLYHVQRLKAAGRIPDIPVFLDSPMAVNASDIFCRHLEDHRLNAKECHSTCNVARYVRSVDESKELDANDVPKVIISASGMATGGRVLHHLKRFIGDQRNTILFTGFQAAGTRGALITGAASQVKIFGQYYPVRAEIGYLHAMSAHADANEILAWLGHFRSPPAMTFIVHGEPSASDALRKRVSSELGWDCRVPERSAVADLS